MASQFPGFPQEALQFLRALKKNNRREWFQPRKEKYDALVKAPMIELVEAVNAELVRFAPDYVTEAKKAIFRIYRDTRFSADKTPYKTNVSAAFGKSTMKNAGLYFSVSPENVEVAGGLYHPERDVILWTRQYIAEHHAE